MMSSVVELRPRATGNISLQSSDDTVTDSLFDEAYARAQQTQTSVATDSMLPSRTTGNISLQSSHGTVTDSLFDDAYARAQQAQTSVVTDSMLPPRTTGNISLQSSHGTVTDSLFDEAYARAQQAQTSVTTDSMLRPRTTGNISLQSSHDTVTDSLFDEALARAQQTQTSVATDSMLKNVLAVENRTAARKGPNQTTVVAEQINRREQVYRTDATSCVQNVDHGHGHRGKHQGKIGSQPQMSHGYNLGPPCSVTEKAGPTVFLTYLDSKDTSRDVLAMSSYLESKGMKVRIDVNETPLRTMSINNWLNETVETSNFIIVCVDKLYKNTIAKGNHDKGNQMHYQAYYIFNQLQTEYMMNNCLNFRVLPVLVGGATLKDVPLFLLNTTVYQWPQSKSQLVDRIFKRQEYSSPELGVEPVAIFDKCTN